MGVEEQLVGVGAESGRLARTGEDRVVGGALVGGADDVFAVEFDAHIFVPRFGGVD
ncbi:hypothetical protein SDC9_100695 [bioreactor metagenome]|uniref:Uncharacterized protein n=1 Tax=bioreactor metagenome TaxID=1076179 RepID=A0A645AL23_9ZZZZ